MLFSEFDADVSPEHDILFREIAGELAYRRRVKMAENDRFLRDFKSGWQGTMKDSEDGSVLDPPIPQAYIDEWFRMTGPQSTYGLQKDVESITAGGVVISPSGDGGITLRQGASGSIVITAEQFANFIAGCHQGSSQRSPNVPAPVANVASSHQGYSQLERIIESDPQRKKRFEENMKEMERWAKQSSMSYPRGG